MQIVIFTLIISSFYLFGRWWRNHTWSDDAPYEGMGSEIVGRMIKFAGITRKDTVYELGSGDGRVVIACAMKNVKEVVGAEIDWLRVLYSRLWLKVLRLKNAKIIHQKVFDVEIGKASVVIILLINLY